MYLYMPHNVGYRVSSFYVILPCEAKQVPPLYKDSQGYERAFQGLVSSFQTLVRTFQTYKRRWHRIVKAYAPPP